MNWYKQLEKESQFKYKDLMKALPLAGALALPAIFHKNNEEIIENNNIVEVLNNKIKNNKKRNNIVNSPSSQPSYEKIKDNSGIELIYGKDISPEFKSKVVEVSNRLSVDPNNLMAIIAFETGGKFKSNTQNGSGSGAVGLIQFMPSTAKRLGTSTSDLAKMKEIEQLEYVYKYLLPYKGKMKTLEDMYMAVLWPAAVGQPEDYVLFTKNKNNAIYNTNKGLDSNNDGIMTKREIGQKIRNIYNKGLERKG